MAVAAPGQITWTVLPAGWATDGSQSVNLSLVATPQLVSADPAATMAEFPLFNGATLWPDLMAASSFVVTFASINSATLTPNTAAIDSTLWKLVFPDTLPVAAFSSGAAAAVAAQTTQSYSVQTNLRSVLGVYHQTPSTAVASTGARIRPCWRRFRPSRHVLFPMAQTPPGWHTSSRTPKRSAWSCGRRSAHCGRSTRC